jgi:predicted nuclease of restriction endonuclease-like (RecB) superfamily
MTENKDYIKFVNDLKSKIRQAQYKAYRAVNTEVITLYWEIGQSIVDKQEELGWGQKIIQQLSEDLQKEFPKNSGFSYANLDRMRKFYLTYKANPKLAQLVRLPAELLTQLPSPSVIENKLKELEEKEK